MCLPKITKGTGHFFFFLKCCSGMWRRHHRGGDTKKLEFYLIFFYQTQGLLSKFTHDTVEPEGQRVRVVMIHITSHHVYFAATCMNFCVYIWIFPSTATRPPPPPPTTHPARWSSPNLSQCSGTLGNQIPVCHLLWTVRCHEDPPSGLHTAGCPGGNPPVGMGGCKDPLPCRGNRFPNLGRTNPHSPD